MFHDWRDALEWGQSEFPERVCRGKLIFSGATGRWRERRESITDGGEDANWPASKIRTDSRRQMMMFRARWLAARGALVGSPVAPMAHWAVNVTKLLIAFSARCGIHTALPLSLGFLLVSLPRSMTL